MHYFAMFMQIECIFSIKIVYFVDLSVNCKLTTVNTAIVIKLC